MRQQVSYYQRLLLPLVFRLSSWLAWWWFVWLGLDAIHSNFIVLDECAHIPAGLSYFQLHEFRLYRENPPLIQAIAGLPALLSGAEVNYVSATGDRPEIKVGYEFLYLNAARIYTLVDRSRYAILGLGLSVGLLIYLWARKIEGDRAATFCALLWLLDPNVIAFSTVVTCDIGSVAFGTLSLYLFWRFLLSPQISWLVASGLSLGLAQGTKFNLLLLYPAMFVIAGIGVLLCRGEIPSNFRRRVAVGLAAIFGISLLMLNTLYLFQGTLTPLGAYGFRSQAFSGQSKSSLRELTGNRFRGTLFESFPVPLPKDYVLGLDSQKRDSEMGLINLENGRCVIGGHWYSPLGTLFFKLPLGTLILFILVAIKNVRWRRPKLLALVLAVPVAVQLILLASLSGLNWPVRYSLCILPLLFVAAAGTVELLARRRLGKYMIICCLVVNGIELAREAPAYISFGNQIAGGSQGAQRLFLGSNFDWGQDLIRLKAWCDSNPDRKPLVISYYGSVAPDFVGLTENTLPPSFLRDDSGWQSPVTEMPRTFYWAVSSNILNGMSGRFSLHDGRVLFARINTKVLDPEKALFRVGKTIYVFRIDPDSSIGAEPSVPRSELHRCLVPFDDGELGEDASP